MLCSTGKCKNSAVHLEDSREKATSYKCEVFTHYKLVSVSSTITQHLLFVHVCPCMSLLRQGF